MNIDKLINDITGRSGPTLFQKSKLVRVKDEIELLQAKIQTKNFEANVDLSEPSSIDKYLECHVHYMSV